MSEYKFTPRAEIEKELQRQAEEQKRKNELEREEAERRRRQEWEIDRDVWIDRFPFIPQITEVYGNYMTANFEGDEPSEKFSELPDEETSYYDWFIFKEKGGDKRRTSIVLNRIPHEDQWHLILREPAYELDKLQSALEEVSSLPVEIYKFKPSTSSDNPSPKPGEGAR